MNIYGRFFSRLFFLLLAAPALLLSAFWGVALISEFGNMDWLQRLKGSAIVATVLAISVASIYGYRRVGIQAAAAKLVEDVALAQSVDRLVASNRSWDWLPVLVLMLLLGAAFAFAAYFSWGKGSPIAAIGFSSLALLALATAAEQVRQLLLPGPRLAIDQHGLHHVLYGSIAWQELFGFRLHSLVLHGRTINILKLGVRQPHRYVARAGWLMRLSKLGVLRTKPDHGVIDVPLAALSASPVAIMAMMERMRRDFAPHVLQHWHESFSAKEVESMQVLQKFGAEVSALGNNPSLEEMQAFDKRMAAQLPDMEAASRFVVEQGKQRRRKIRRQGWIALAVTIAVVLLYALKFFVSD